MNVEIAWNDGGSKKSMNNINKAQLLSHIAASDLTAVEKRNLMELVRAAGAQERFHRHIIQRFERKE